MHRITGTICPSSFSQVSSNCSLHPSASAQALDTCTVGAPALCLPLGDRPQRSHWLLFPDEDMEAAGGLSLCRGPMARLCSFRCSENLLFQALRRHQLGGRCREPAQLCLAPEGCERAAGGPNAQPCLEPPGWDHSPAAFELLPTSRPPGIRPGMPASRERRQLGWQPAHGARAVSQEAGPAGLRPPASEWGPWPGYGTGPSFSLPQLQGGPAGARSKLGSGT